MGVYCYLHSSGRIIFPDDGRKRDMEKNWSMSPARPEKKNRSRLIFQGRVCLWKTNKSLTCLRSRHVPESATRTRIVNGEKRQRPLTPGGWRYALSGEEESNKIDLFIIRTLLNTRLPEGKTMLATSSDGLSFASFYLKSWLRSLIFS